MENSEKDLLYKIRHSTAHVMAQAVMELYPDAKLAIGPPIESGFYYDFDLGKDSDGKPLAFSPEDLEKIEKRMRQSSLANMNLIIGNSVLMRHVSYSKISLINWR